MLLSKKKVSDDWHGEGDIQRDFGHLSTSWTGWPDPFRQDGTDAFALTDYTLVLSS